jgi:hypothetical protein
MATKNKTRYNLVNLIKRLNKTKELLQAKSSIEKSKNDIKRYNYF